ncbi:hypothetical protein HJFPF1_10139 [Paramyrothecium foliicola]|nr:hypothetical protein HJFPF1_10139 [Paramyrothecium foliicola]
MKTFALLSLAAAVAYAQNTTLSLEVAFPCKDTSNKNPSDPVVFSLHAAEENFKFGYNLNWEIVSIDKNYTGTVAVASITRANSKKESVDDVWYAASGVPQASELEAGDYSFNWEWKMMSSIQKGQVVTYNFQEEVSSGSTKFTMAEGGDKKKLPAFETNLTMGESSDDILNEDLAACVQKNSSDKSICSRMTEESKPIPQAGKSKQSETEERVYGDAVDGNANSGPDSAGPRVSASQVGPLALLVAIGGALLL